MTWLMLIVFPNSRVVPLILSFPPRAKAEGSTVGKAMRNINAHAIDPWPDRSQPGDV